jgi:hypothetical protein
MSYLEKLIVGGRLAQRAAVLDGLLEFGGLGDHDNGEFGVLREIVVWICWKEREWSFWLGE